MHMERLSFFGVGIVGMGGTGSMWKPLTYRVGQNHIYTVYIRYSGQGKHQIYGHARCIYTVLANPVYMCSYF